MVYGCTYEETHGHEIHGRRLGHVRTVVEEMQPRIVRTLVSGRRCLFEQHMFAAREAVHMIINA